MPAIEKLRQLLSKDLLASELKSEALSQLELIEEELEELRFISNRLQWDQQVNENFIKKTVELLEESNEELRSSNNKFKKLNEELKKSNEELERFAFIASHDLKTPLHNIIKFSGLLKHQLKDDTSSLVKESLEFIIEGGKRMNDLIVDVLEYSKLTNQGSNEKAESINFAELIDRIQISISEYLGSQNAHIELDMEPVLITGIYSKLFILFKNLIENGIKYNTSERRLIQIRSEKKDTHFVFYIKDNGIGIPPEYHEKIFKMFSRLHHQKDYEGTGLGLSTCKKIVEELNGSISLKSTPNEGATFIIHLPVSIIQLNLQEQNP